MSIVKSFSVDYGDMFYIKHGSSNFSIIDCYLPDDYDKKEDIVEEIKLESRDKYITRFISTHPDNDHIYGLKYLDDEINILNFYCIKNKVIKEDETEGFIRYCELRDSEKAFYLSKGCERKWMNIAGENDSGKYIGSSGLDIIWPDTNNGYFKLELESAENGGNPNNTSIILKYSIENGATIMWMGDLESDFMDNIEYEIKLPKTNVLFAPHHGRKTGKVPSKWLNEMNPDIIILGEAPSENLDYADYNDYNIITQIYYSRYANGNQQF